MEINMKHYKDSNNQIFAYEEDGSQDHLIGDKISVTQAEADSINEAKYQEMFLGLNYAEKRIREYPSIADQLDTLYHSGLDAWKAQIKTVKDKYPKV
jgi:hypothetical protein